MTAKLAAPTAGIQLPGHEAISHNTPYRSQ
jgi:hypothetical protein